MNSGTRRFVAGLLGGLCFCCGIRFIFDGVWWLSALLILCAICYLFIGGVLIGRN